MVHKFRMFDTNIVADVNSGAVHVLDDAAFDVLEQYEKIAEKGEGLSMQLQNALGQKYSASEISEALEEIRFLESNGQLFSEDIYSGYLTLQDKKTYIKAMCLHVSHDCNMRCGYCFASTGDFGAGRCLMSPETGKNAIDFLIKASGERRNLEIDFFGGEPLMNFKTVTEIVDYARSLEKENNKNFRFTITTNALMLNEEHREYINKNIGNIVLSIDGRQQTNDNMRKRVDGSGTYSHILPKIKEMAQSRNQQNYYVRGTYTRQNLDFSQDVLHLADEGFEQISVEPVVAAKDSGYDLREEDLPLLFNEYEKLSAEYVKRSKEGRGFNFFHFMVDLDQGPCIAKRMSGCGSGHDYVAVTPEGDIYPCHQFVGMEEFKMGNINEDTLDKEIQDLFKSSNVASKEDCRNCWAKYYCSGGCAANAFQFNNDIGKPYKIGCELEKKRVECALWIKTQL